MIAIQVGVFTSDFVWYKNTDGQDTVGYQRPVFQGFDDTYANILAVDVDSDLDIIASTNDEIVCFDNTDAQGNFSAPDTVTQDVDNVNFVNTVDIDGDGDLDIISTSYVDRKLAWYENTDGQGTFTTEHEISSSEYKRTLTN